MEKDQLRHILSELRFSADLSDDVARQLAEASTMATFPSGSVIFREGAQNTDLYLVRSGRVGLEMTVPGRGRLKILTLGPGDMLGWSALLDGGEMTGTARAIEETQAVVASAHRLLEICEQDHLVGYVLMERMARALSRRLVATRLQLLDLFAAESPQIPEANPEE